jgi:hypothetical protein
MAQVCINMARGPWEEKLQAGPIIWRLAATTAIESISHHEGLNSGDVAATQFFHE